MWPGGHIKFSFQTDSKKAKIIFLAVAGGSTEIAYLRRLTIDRDQGFTKIVYIAMGILLLSMKSSFLLLFSFLFAKAHCVT